MASGEIRKGDTGTVIRVTLVDGTTPVDVSSASSITFIFKKPSGTVVEKTGALFTDGTDGKVQYTTESGFLDEIGDWSYQVETIIGGNTWRSDIACLTIHGNLN